MNDLADSRLRTLGWMSLTPAAFQDEVLAKADRLVFAPGEAVYRQGDETGGVLGVIDGRVELHLQGGGTDPSLTHLAGPGFWTGDLAAISNRPRRIGVVARDTVQILRLPRSEMLRMTDRDPAIWRHFATLAAISLGVAIDIADALRRTDPVARVAATLLNLAQSMPGEVSLSQADLGSISGLSRGVVNAALGTLAARGLLERRYRGVVLTDVAGLARVSSGG